MRTYLALYCCCQNKKDVIAYLSRAYFFESVPKSKRKTRQANTLEQNNLPIEQHTQIKD